ncbi:lipoprotein [Thauera sp.]|jgi:predicted small lipoprotein YifL|uniref:LPS translocon maturation chaperone LptM n=1 Tax=Thauera sp. TaxID=1905334 RepID=UPI00263127FF|nr:lipoprotein [Thauera sp.]MCK6408085.1 lipoprotein [Thauera sp.]
MRAKLPAIALACALLSACGIKGPLYLPAPGTTTAPATGADHSKPVLPPDLIKDSPLE